MLIRDGYHALCTRAELSAFSVEDAEAMGNDSGSILIRRAIKTRSWAGRLSLPSHTSQAGGLWRGVMAGQSGEEVRDKGLKC